MQMKPADLSLPVKACHNCRRRRWKCDRSLPVCQKCLSSGSDCLGYGKLFVWNHGVASRGKMMGKSYEERLSTKKEGQEQVLPLHPKALLPEQQEGFGGYFAESTSPSELVQYENPTITSIQWPLTDPLVQDLNENFRYYLFHFVSQLSCDMVAYDGPDQNPIRDLVPATSSCPLLLQVIVANSALHLFNISRNPLEPSAYQEKAKQALAPYWKTMTRFTAPHGTSYRDALVAKQQALSLLAQEVATIDNSNIDIILATVLLFVNYDLIETGKDMWKVHMEGARELINLLGTSPYRPHSMSKLRVHLLADFLV